MWLVCPLRFEHAYMQAIDTMKHVLTHFKHLPLATGILNEKRKLLRVTIGPKSLGNARFVTVKISSQSVIE